ncbi:MAG: hypothetical protein V1716_04250 [Candidatus Uhrbacteria bacterium]
MAGVISFEQRRGDPKLKVIAEEYLSAFRKDEALGLGSLELFNEALKQSGLCPEDIGSSKEEVAIFLDKAAKCEAKKALKAILANDFPEINLRCLIKAMERGNLIPEDIGTTPEVLNRFFGIK